MADKPIKQWTLDDYARHYADILVMPPNGWGQHVSPHFGQSHQIMIAASKLFGVRRVEAAFKAAVAEKEAETNGNVGA